MSTVPALFFRGTKEVFREHIDPRDAQHYQYRRYVEPFYWSRPPKPMDVMTEWREVFERNENWHCPCCHAVIYNSQNYMEFPEWLVKAEMEAGGL